MQMKDIKEALEEYKSTKQFEEDCDSMKSGFILKEGYLPDDAVIEGLVLKDKETLFSIDEECRINGHDLADEGIEEFGGEIWTYCRRCGEYFEVEDEGKIKDGERGD